MALSCRMITYYAKIVVIIVVLAQLPLLTFYLKFIKTASVDLIMISYIRTKLCQ